MYCVIACIVYCKQCILLLLATCYCCVIHQLSWFMYRVVFTVGVVVTRRSLTLADALTDYSYINNKHGNALRARIARCLTGLAPTDTNNGANGDLGGLYFNGTMIPNSDESSSCGTDVILVRPGATAAGVINIEQCGEFTIHNEGIYTCTMMTSSIMDQSVRFGIYLNGRCESLDLYTHNFTIFHLSTQLLQQ